MSRVSPPAMRVVPSGQTWHGTDASRRRLGRCRCRVWLHQHDRCIGPRRHRRCARRRSPPGPNRCAPRPRVAVSSSEVMGVDYERTRPNVNSDSDCRSGGKTRKGEEPWGALLVPERTVVIDFSGFCGVGHAFPGRLPTGVTVPRRIGARFSPRLEWKDGVFPRSNGPRKVASAPADQRAGLGPSLAWVMFPRGGIHPEPPRRVDGAVPRWTLPRLAGRGRPPMPIPSARWRRSHHR